MRRFVLAAVVTLVLCPAAVKAEEGVSPAPTTHPSHQAADHRERSFGRDHLGTARPVEATTTDSTVTDKEVADISAFMSKYAPKRWEKFQTLRQERQQRLWPAMRAQMRMLEKIKTEDPRIYELRLARLTLEDDMFAMGWKLNHEEIQNKAEVRAELRQKASEFFDNVVQEQKIRIDRMQDHLRKQQADIAAAQQKLQEFVDRRNAVIDKGVEDLASEHAGALKELGGPMFRPSKPREANPPATEPSADNSDAPAAQ